MQFTKGAAKVLGGEMMGLMRPKLANLAIAGAGAIATAKSADSMNNGGLTVGNGLGAAAGSAAMAIGGYRAGIHRLATSQGSAALSKRLGSMAKNYAKAEGSNSTIRKGLVASSRGLKNASYNMARKEAKSAGVAAMKAREASLDSRISSLTSQQKGKSWDPLGLKTMFRKNKPLSVDERRAASVHANATLRRQNQTPKSVNQAAYKAREAAAQAQVDSFVAGRERVAGWQPKQQSRKHYVPNSGPQSRATPRQIEPQYIHFGDFTPNPPPTPTKPTSTLKGTAGRIGGGEVKGLISGFKDMGGFSMGGSPSGSNNRSWWRGGSARAMGNGNFSAY